MPIQFACVCGKVLQVGEQFEGQIAKCPKCQTKLRVPPPQASETDTTEDEPVSATKARSSELGKQPLEKVPSVEPVDDAEDDIPEVEPVSLPKSKKAPKGKTKRVLDEEDEREETDEAEEPSEPSEDEDDLEPRKARRDSLSFKFPNHNGDFLDDEADFFVNPPKKLGKIRSGTTSLLQSVEPRTQGERILWSLGISVGVWLFATVVLLIVAVLTKEWAILILSPFFGLVLMPLVGLITYFRMGFKHTCTYVGSRGLARFVCKGDRDNRVQDEVIIFHEDLELRTQIVHNYYNGAYTGTNYTYTWNSPDDGEMFKISGSSNVLSKKPLKVHDLFHFAHNAQKAWTSFLFPLLVDKLEAGDKYTFYLTGKDRVVLTKNRLSLYLGKNVVKLEHDDLAGVQIQNGQVTLKEPGAKRGWITSTGMYEFRYSNLGNADVFLRLLEHFFDIMPH